MDLQGAAELRRRLSALTHVSQGIGRELGAESVRLIAARIPVRTGRTRRSVRIGDNTSSHTTVVGSGVVRILDRGARAHQIRPATRQALKYQQGTQTRFARKVNHPRQPALGIVGSALAEAGHRVDLARHVIDAWNGAA